jgi:hypothetical protein
MSGITKEAEPIFFAVASFTVQLANPLPNGSAHLINPAGEEITEGGLVESKKCKGTAEAPTAEPGNLCVYETEPFHNALASSEGIFDVAASGEGNVGKTGAMIVVVPNDPSPEGKGTWAVTAPE